MLHIDIEFALGSGLVVVMYFIEQWMLNAMMVGIGGGHGYVYRQKLYFRHSLTFSTRSTGQFPRLFWFPVSAIRSIALGMTLR